MDMHRLLTVAIFKTAYKNKHSFHSHSLRCFLKQLAILNGNIKKNVLTQSMADNIVVYKSKGGTFEVHLFHSDQLHTLFSDVE